MRKITAILAGLLIGLSTQVSHADTTSWTSGGNSTVWSDVNNWNNGVPAAGDEAYISDGGVADLDTSYEVDGMLHRLIIDNTSMLNQSVEDSVFAVYDESIGYTGEGTFDQSAGRHILNWNPVSEKADGWLFVGDNEGANGNYYLSGSGSLESGVEIIGVRGSGYFTQNGIESTNTLYGELYLGGSALVENNSGSYGEYNLVAGNLSVVGGYENVIGHAGTGVFNQSGGTFFSQGDIHMGELAGSSGYYRIDAGDLNVAGTMIVGNEGYGQFDLGYYDQDLHVYGGDGLHAAHDLYIGYNGGSLVSRYNLYSGVLNVVEGNGREGFTMVGGKFYGEGSKVGTGVFSQWNGLHSTRGLWLADTVGSNGTYNLYYGRLEAGNMGSRIGVEGQGVFLQTGGTHVTSQLLMGEYSTGHGEYNLYNDGILSAANEFIGNNGSGVFNQHGGFNYVGFDEYGDPLYDGSLNELIVGRFNGSYGEYYFDLGNLYVMREIVGDAGGYGYFEQYGTSEHQIVNDLIIGQDTGTGGSFNLLEDAVLNVGGAVYVGDEGGTGSISVADDAVLNVSRDMVVGTRSETGFDSPELTSNGTVTQTGGIVTIGDEANNSNLILGAYPGTRGTYSLNGGELNINTWAVIGDYGTGTVNQSGGTLTLTGGSADMYLGRYDGAYGEYNLYSNGVLNTGWQYVGWGGNGTFNQYGGLNSQLSGYNVDGHEFNVGTEANSVSRYSLMGGALETVHAFIGRNGSATGTLDQTGGRHSVETDLVIADGADTTGNYYLSSATSDALLEVSMSELVGNYGTATFIQDGEWITPEEDDAYWSTVHTVGSDLNIGLNQGGSATYTLNGGLLGVGGVERIGYLGSAQFMQNGGEHLVGMDWILGGSSVENIVRDDEGNVVSYDTILGHGTYTLAGEALPDPEQVDLSVGGNALLGWGGFGTVEQASGNVLINGDLRLGDMSVFDIRDGSDNVVETEFLLGTGVYNLGGNLSVGGNEFIGYPGTGTFTQTGGIHTIGGDLNMGGTSRRYDADAQGYPIINTIQGIQGNGMYTLNADVPEDEDRANLEVGNSVFIGRGGIGTFDHQNGSVRIGSDLNLGDNVTEWVSDQAGNSGGAILYGNGSYTLHDGALTVLGSERVGSSSTGTFTQWNGAHIIGWDLVLSSDANGAGTYNLYDGDLQVGQFDEDGNALQVGGITVGGTGKGSFVQQSGTVRTSADLNIAQTAYYMSDYTLGALYPFVSGSIYVGRHEHVGFDGIATFNHRSGDNIISGDLVFGNGPTGAGTYYFDGGNVSVGGIEYIGMNGSGTFYHNLGAHTAAIDMNIGHNEDSSGYYRIIDTVPGGSTLAIGRNLNIGLAGTGTFEQTDSAVDVGSGVVLGTGSTGVGTYTMTRGTLDSQWIHAGVDGSGSFSQTEGAVNTGTVYLGISHGRGTYTIDDGKGGEASLTANSLLLGSGNNGVGQFFMNGGTVNVINGFGISSTLDDGTPANQSRFTLNDGILNVNLLGGETKIGGDSNGYFTQTGGAFNFGGAFYLGDHNYATPAVGQYTMTDGIVNGSALVLGEWGGIGRVDLSGGEMDLGALTLARQNDPEKGGPGQGYFTMASGGDAILRTGTTLVGEAGIGVFDQRSGTHQVSGDLSIGVNPGSTGRYELTGGELRVDGTLNNGVAGTAEFTMSGSQLIAANAVNNGTFRVTSAGAEFTQSFTNNNMLITGDSDLFFNTLTVNPNGVIQAGSDMYNISGSFLNGSARAGEWNTAQATFTFTGNPAEGHTFGLAGEDFGFDRAGYTNNFALGTLDITGVNNLMLVDGNEDTATAALYAGVVLGVQFSGLEVSNILGNGFNIYYDETLAGNAYLSNTIYNLNSGGQLRPVGVVPEPVSMLLFVVGGGVLAGARRRKNRG